jgi:hypothetical protein
MTMIYHLTALRAFRLSLTGGLSSWSLLYNLSMVHMEDGMSSIVATVSVAMEMCFTAPLPSNG